MSAGVWLCDCSYNVVITDEQVLTYHYAVFIMFVFGSVIGICFISVVVLAVSKTCLFHLLFHVHMYHCDVIESLNDPMNQLIEM